MNASISINVFHRKTPFSIKGLPIGSTTIEQTNTISCCIAFFCRISHPIEDNDKINVIHPQAHLPYCQMVLVFTLNKSVWPVRHETMRINSALLSIQTSTTTPPPPPLYTSCPIQNVLFILFLLRPNRPPALLGKIHLPPCLFVSQWASLARLILCGTTSALAPTSYYNKILLHIHVCLPRRHQRRGTRSRCRTQPAEPKHTFTTIDKRKGNDFTCGTIWCAPLGMQIGSSVPPPPPPQLLICIYEYISFRKPPMPGKLFAWTIFGLADPNKTFTHSQKYAIATT